MAFPTIEFDLTDDQVAALGPFADEIGRNAGSNISAEIFVIPTDYRYRRVRAHLLDALAFKTIQTAALQALNDYDVRQERIQRLNDLQGALARRGLVVSKNENGLIVERDGHKYELREVAAGGLTEA